MKFPDIFLCDFSYAVPISAQIQVWVYNLLSRQALKWFRPSAWVHRTWTSSASIRISFIQYHVNAVLLGNDDRNELINLPEFGPNIDDIRVSVFQYVDAYNDQLYSNPQDFRWWISNVNPDNNTAYIRLRNLAPYGVALRGDFYILVMIRDWGCWHNVRTCVKETTLSCKLRIAFQFLGLEDYREPSGV